MENQTSNKDTTTQNSFRKKINKTTFEVTVHFNEHSTETLSDKIKRLIVNESENLTKKPKMIKKTVLSNIS